MKRFEMDGYVCGKVETRSTATGKQITTFSINSPERRKNQQTGDYENFPQFFDCQYWHRFDSDFRASSITDKAHLVLVGEPRYESWEKDGQKRSKVVFNVTDLWEVFDKSKMNAPKPEYVQATVYDDPYYDEDLPF